MAYKYDKKSEHMKIVKMPIALHGRMKLVAALYEMKTGKRMPINKLILTACEEFIDDYLTEHADYLGEQGAKNPEDSKGAND